MPYTAQTILPSYNLSQFAKPTATSPRLSLPIGATDTTIVLTVAPVDYLGVAITGDCILGIQGEGSYTENIWCPTGSISGVTITGAVRGVRLDGLDNTTGDATLAVAHNQNSEVVFAISPVMWQQLIGAFKGALASGGTTWKIGRGIDESIYVYAYNADGTKPYWRYDSVTSQWLFSNDGVSETPFGSGAGVTGGDGIAVTAGDIDIDLTDTVIFVSTSSGSGDSGKVSRLDSTGKSPVGFVAYDPIVSMVSLKRFKSQDNFVTASAAGGSATANDIYITLVTAATNGQYATVGFTPSVGGEISIAGKNPNFSASGVFVTSAVQDGFIGLVEAATTFPANGAMTQHHACFIVDDATLYASTGDGAAQTKSADLGVTVTGVHYYDIVKSGSHYLFYVDGILKYTSTANEPVDNMSTAGGGVIAKENVAKTMRISRSIVTFDY